MKSFLQKKDLSTDIDALDFKSFFHSSCTLRTEYLWTEIFHAEEFYSWFLYSMIVFYIIY